MASSEIKIEEVYDYFKQNGGVVRNRDVVHYFKHYLTDQYSKDDARAKFKKFVNTIAQTKVENNEKFLFLKPKYLNSLDCLLPSPNLPQYHSPVDDPRNSIGIPLSPIESPQTPTGRQGLPRRSREPPPYRPPPPPPKGSSSTPVKPSTSSSMKISNSEVRSPTTSMDNISISSSMFDQEGSSTPQAPPRRRTIEKQKSLVEEDVTPKKDETDESLKDENEGEDKKSVSVKERTQKFNRLASVEDDLNGQSPSYKGSAEKNKNDKVGVQTEDDGASIEQKKCMEWYVTASKGDFQGLLKLAKDEPRLVNKKDPFTAYTVLHWGAKHGNGEIIKIFAGKYKVDINGKTNGGYTPLHLAAQFGHKDVYRLLELGYKADPQIRDYSGRTPQFYLLAKERRRAQESMRKVKGLKKQSSEKDLGFLRIGSLNVRVKKTTEAFSNFLGVGGGSVISPNENSSDKILKGWGSADNVNQENEMPAPKGYLVKKKSKRPLEHSSGVQSTPTTPKQATRSSIHRFSTNDSDSDTAAGFDSQWKS